MDMKKKLKKFIQIVKIVDNRSALTHKCGQIFIFYTHYTHRNQNQPFNFAEWKSYERASFGFAA